MAGDPARLGLGRTPTYVTCQEAMRSSVLRVGRVGVRGAAAPRGFWKSGVCTVLAAVSHGTRSQRSSSKETGCVGRAPGVAVW